MQPKRQGGAARLRGTRTKRAEPSQSTEENRNLVAAWTPPAIHDASAGADRGIDRPSTPDPKYAQRHHKLSSMDKRKEADFFGCPLRHQGERTEVRWGMEKGSWDTVPILLWRSQD